MTDPSDQADGELSVAEKQPLSPQALKGEEEEEKEEESVSAGLEFELAIEKTESGFGIYFAKLTGEPGDPDAESATSEDRLVVDGFVESEGEGSDVDDPSINANGSLCHSLRALKLGDVLIGVNGVDCQGKDIMDVVGLLRSAEIGSNTLRFLRPQEPSDESDDDEFPAEDGGKKLSVKGSFMGALLKVTSKIKAEIVDEEGAQRLEEENELFQKQWLEEFDRFKIEYETKWETCTYEADEFCGLIYHSADGQQKQYLQREYPTLIEAWQDDVTGRSLRASWPAARSVYVDPVPVKAHPLSPSPEHAQTRPQLHDVQCSPSLQNVLDSLRTEFMWRRVHIEAFVQRLAANGIACCSDLVSALTAKRGRQFMQSFQSLQYPRLTPTISRALLQRAQELYSQQEELMSLALVPTLKVTHTHGPVTTRNEGRMSSSSMAALRDMFPSWDAAILSELLEANGGDLESTIDMALSMEAPPPAPTQAETTRPPSPRQASRAGPTPRRTTSTARRSRVELPDDFLRLPTDGQVVVERALSAQEQRDAELAAMLQNEIFREQLFADEEFSSHFRDHRGVGPSARRPSQPTVPEKSASEIASETFSAMSERFSTMSDVMKRKMHEVYLQFQTRTDAPSRKDPLSHRPLMAGDDTDEEDGNSSPSRDVRRRHQNAEEGARASMTSNPAVTRRASAYTTKKND